jgi:hypothetical protein
VSGIRKNWTIFPNQGLGPLRFGVSSTEVDTYAKIFGHRDYSASDYVPDSIVQETLDQFGGDLTDQQKAEFIELLRREGSTGRIVTELRGGGLVSLEYDDEKLSAIMVLPEASSLNLEGIRLFAAPPLEVLKLLERLNGEPGLYIANSAFFDRILIYVDGFTEVADGKTVRVFEKFDPDNDASIMMRHASYFPNDVSPQLLQHSWL